MAETILPVLTRAPELMAESHSPVRKPLILKLPAELLTEVLKSAARDTADPTVPASEHVYSYNALWRLALVCRTFSQLARPLLYRTLRISLGQTGDVMTVFGFHRHIQSLHTSLKANPSLRTHCTDVHITISERAVPNEDFSAATELLSALPNVRSLSVHGGLNQKYRAATWSLIQAALHHMPKLGSLRLQSGGSGPYLKDIPHHLKPEITPCLSSLEIDGLCILGDRPTQDVKKKYTNTSSITTLSIKNFNEHSTALEQLLTWPQALTELTFTKKFSSRYGLDFKTLERHLSTHKDTLKSLHLGYLCHISTKGHLLNTSLFPNLETLTISKYQLPTGPGGPREPLSYSPAHADALLSPSLRTLRFDCAPVEGVHDCRRASCYDFHDGEEHWIRMFGREAARRKARLRRIEILFDAAPAPAIPEYFTDPWARMRDLQSELRDFGVEVGYTEPSVPSKEYTVATARELLKYLQQRLELVAWEMGLE
ncbi:hypothetical protein BJX61DRAFT_96471 [Aspergillus egyptiacus]|nr:hypothetical protein BJX61DRAFT_96471 [Aspergillus egyptiacus]